jgi:hypothetical protein
VIVGHEVVPAVLRVAACREVELTPYAAEMVEAGRGFTASFDAYLTAFATITEIDAEASRWFEQHPVALCAVAPDLAPPLARSRSRRSTARRRAPAASCRCAPTRARSGCPRSRCPSCVKPTACRSVSNCSRAGARSAPSSRSPAGSRPSSAAGSSLDVARGRGGCLLGRAALLACADVRRVPLRPVVLRRRLLVGVMALGRFAQERCQRCDVHDRSSLFGDSAGLAVCDVTPTDSRLFAG